MQRRKLMTPKIQRTLRRFLTRHQILASISLLAITSCTSGPIPRWDGKLWAGDSAHGGITRAQEQDPAKRTIQATDPRFDEYVAMTYEDFRGFVATYIYQCKSWKDGTQMMSPKQAEMRFQIILDE